MTIMSIYNAFIAPDENFGGNPSTVVLEADGLSEPEKNKILKNSETKDVVFVSKPTSKRADFRFQFFTNSEEIIISGHSSVAAFAALREHEMIEEGNFAIELVNGGIACASNRGGETYIEQQHPIYEEPSMDDIMSVLTATAVPMPNVLHGFMPMVVCSTSRSFVIGVKDLKTLENMKPDFEKLKKISADLDIIGFVFFSPETLYEKNDFSTRVFAPVVGVNEESASGTLAGALGCYVYDLQESEQDKFLIEQGYFMDPKKPSFIKVYMETEGRKFSGPRVGGFSKKASD